MDYLLWIIAIIQSTLAEEHYFSKVALFQGLRLQISPFNVPVGFEQSHTTEGVDDLVLATGP